MRISYSEVNADPTHVKFKIRTTQHQAIYGGSKRVTDKINLIEDGLFYLNIHLSQTVY